MELVLNILLGTLGIVITAIPFLYIAALTYCINHATGACAKMREKRADKKFLKRLRIR